MCKFNEAWVGCCKKEPEKEYCEEHKDLVCCSCGAKATRSCDETGDLVCGAPLCDDCTHNMSFDGTNNGYGQSFFPKGQKSHCKKSEKIYYYWMEVDYFVEQVYNGLFYMVNFNPKEALPAFFSDKAMAELFSKKVNCKMVDLRTLPQIDQKLKITHYLHLNLQKREVHISKESARSMCGGTEEQILKIQELLNEAIVMMTEKDRFPKVKYSEINAILYKEYMK